MKRTKITVTASENRLGATTIKVLEAVGAEQGIDEFIVTSTQRKPRQQATAMYENIANGRNIRYKWAGEQVCELCRQMLGIDTVFGTAERYDIDLFHRRVLSLFAEQSLYELLAVEYP